MWAAVELLGGEIAEDLAAFGITNTVRYKAAPDTAFCREMRAVADVEARGGNGGARRNPRLQRISRARADRGQPLRDGFRYENLPMGFMRWCSM